MSPLSKWMGKGKGFSQNDGQLRNNNVQKMTITAVKMSR